MFYSRLHCEVTALFGEIKPDGNNFFIPKQSSDGHLHSVVESWSGAQWDLILVKHMLRMEGLLNGENQFVFG